jgi:uncharacterized protein YcaQ
MITAGQMAGRAGASRTTLRALRALAVSGSLRESPSLQAALDLAGFVQAAPSRAPARAQDLLLRQRVAGYRAGDLERLDPELAVEEGMLHAYGFLARALWSRAHPRRATGLTKLERRVLDAVTERGQAHPDDLAAAIGAARERNAWGGQSRVTTLALDELHHRGLLRVLRRDAGVRVYEPASADEPPAPEARLRPLILAIARQLAPVPEASLRQAVRGLRRVVPRARAVRAVTDDLLREGALLRRTVDGAESLLLAEHEEPEAEQRDTPRVVRFLAPFDPVVWDRRRFEHLWGWPYRFEAYTPVAKRLRGYYAMPLLWVDRVIGWVNARVEGGRLHVEPGFVGPRPRGAEWRRELEAEVARLDAFLRPG